MPQSRLQVTWQRTLAAASCVLIVALMWWLFSYRVYDFPDARISCEASKSSPYCQVEFLVLDKSGNPLSGVEVESDSFSGWTGPEITDAEGRATTEPGECEVLAVSVDRREFQLYRFLPDLSPCCNPGMKITVVLKDRYGVQIAGQKRKWESGDRSPHSKGSL